MLEGFNDMAANLARHLVGISLKPSSIALAYSLTSVQVALKLCWLCMNAAQVATQQVQVENPMILILVAIVLVLIAGPSTEMYESRNEHKAGAASYSYGFGPFQFRTRPTFATTILDSEGVGRDALDVALPAVHHQALAVGDDVLHRHDTAGLTAHHRASLTAKLGGDLICFFLHHCQHLLPVLQQPSQLTNPTGTKQL